MTNLPEKNTCAYEAFNGQFSVNFDNPFGWIPVDQTTEVTVNKDTQTPGGTARFSMKAGAIKRYYIIVEHRMHCWARWVNPFAEKQDLISISTARTAPKDIASDLMKTHEIGEQCYSNFKEERLEKDPPVKQFHDPIPANKLKTFSNLYKKKEVKSSGRVIILKADKSLFGRIIVMAQGRNLKMEDILSHPLGPLPWALSTVYT